MRRPFWVKLLEAVVKEARCRQICHVLNVDCVKLSVLVEVRSKLG